MKNLPTLPLGSALIKYYGYGAKSTIVVQFPNADDHIIINMLSKRNARSKSYSKAFDHNHMFITDGYEEKTFESCVMTEKEFMGSYCWNDMDKLANMISKYIKQSYYFKTNIMTNSLIMLRDQEDGSCKQEDDKTPGYSYTMKFNVNIHINNEQPKSYSLVEDKDNQ